jgi:hypothetical protein
VDELWGDSFAEPVFVLTSDQDWAPEWAMERFLTYIEKTDVPVHVFATSPSPALARAPAALPVTLGAHPNFAPASSQGSTPHEVIETCRSLVPEAKTFRSHAYWEDSYTLDLLLEAGFETDSNLCLFLQPRIVPLVHATGLLRLPVFLDDDSLLLWDRDGGLRLDPVFAALATPGLKILNFHPVLFALNCPSVEHYQARRDTVYAPGSEAYEPFEGRGTATVLEELIARIRDTGGRLVPFPAIADRAWRDLRAIANPALYGWGKRR